MDLQQAIAKVVTQFTKLNPTLVDCVNKRAKTMEVFKQEIYEYMDKYIPKEFHDRCYEELCAAAWHYDILKPLIEDDGTISDIVCHDWDNVWVMERGKWRQLDYHFRDQDHYRRFFDHVCFMNNISINEVNASDNCTDITTCPRFRMRLNFVHKSINTEGTNVFSIRKTSTTKKTLEDLTEPKEGMLTKEMIPIVLKHLEEATGILIVGQGGSGKTTFLNALFEELPTDWKYLIIQENEELFSYTHKNTDFLKTVKSKSGYGATHDLRELGRNALLMTIKCLIVGETKGEEAVDMLNCIINGALGITTLHTNSSRKGPQKMANYIMYASGYSLEQCLDMLTVMNKVFYLKDYRLREITTVRDFDAKTGQLIMETEYYNEH